MHDIGKCYDKLGFSRGHSKDITRVIHEERVIIHIYLLVIYIVEVENYIACGNGKRINIVGTTIHILL